MKKLINIGVDIRIDGRDANDWDKCPRKWREHAVIELEKAHKRDAKRDLVPLRIDFQTVKMVERSKLKS